MLKEFLEDYKNITLKLIFEVGQIENLQKLLDERQKIIQDVEQLGFDKNEFVKIAEELKLLELEEELQNKLKKEKVKLKQDIDKAKKMHSARRSYAAREGNSNFFDKIT